MADIVNVLKEEAGTLRDSWEQAIVEELQKVKGNLEFLSGEDRRIVEKIISTGKLPRVDREVVEAINKMFTHFKVVEIKIEDLLRSLGNTLLTPEELKRKLESIIASYDGDPNVRIKIVSKSGE